MSGKRKKMLVAKDQDVARTPAPVFDLFSAGRPTYEFNCRYCGTTGKASRPDKSYCSERCRKRYADGLPKTRSCRQCAVAIKIESGKDGNRRYCSRTCSKKARDLQNAAWFAAHPEAMPVYNARRALRRPDGEKDRNESGRREIIKALGGACCVCGVTNVLWLEVDYKPTTRGKPFRHPRHRAFVLSHLNDFRLLCANHHRELTLTGQIDGTDIRQASAPLERSVA